MIIAAVAIAGPGRAKSYDQFKKWCFDDATNDRKIAGCNAVIITNREPAEAMAAAYYKRGNAYSNKGNAERAIEDYGQAIRLKPDYVAAFHNRANIYDEMGQYDRALADYDRAIEIWPQFWFGLVHRGVTYTRLESTSAPSASSTGQSCSIQATPRPTTDAAMPITSCITSSARSRT